MIIWFLKIKCRISLKPILPATAATYLIKWCVNDEFDNFQFFIENEVTSGLWWVQFFNWKYCTIVNRYIAGKNIKIIYIVKDNEDQKVQSQLKYALDTADNVKRKKFSLPNSSFKMLGYLSRKNCSAPDNFAMSSLSSFP